MFCCGSMFPVITNRRIHVCLNDVKNKTNTDKIKCEKTHRAGESPSKPDARTRSQMHFFLEHRVTQCGVKEKRHWFWLLAVDVFTLTWLQMEHSWILTLCGARTPPHPTPPPPRYTWWLFHVHEPMKRLSHVRVEVFSPLIQCKVHPAAVSRTDGRLPSLLCICVVSLYSKR